MLLEKRDFFIDMGSVEEKVRGGGFGSHNLFEEMRLLKEMQDHNGLKKSINSELWHACGGPLVTLPQIGSLVYYFPQGHSEQVAVSTNRTATTQTPSYPNLPSELLCQVHNVTLHADKETDEIYAQMSLQPVNSEKDVFPIPDFGLKPSKHPTDFFCKTLTASDTSTHGGFSVPRRAAEKLFPQLDYSLQPPSQELVVRDLHDNTWTFRHIYRGQPKRHLLTTGWSMFVGAKRLRAGDAVLFIRDENSQLLLGVRRANRQQTTMPSSVLSADSMHIGILAAAAHAAANRTPFTIFYNPRACPSEFVVPFAKYTKSVHGTQLSIGMRFGMMFETEESNKRRYMGTIIGMSDFDPLRWPNSKWRSLQVEWDDPGCGDKHNRASPWEIETPESLFIFPSLTACLKRPFHSAFMGSHTEWESMTRRPIFRVPPENLPSELQCSPMSSLWSEQVMNMLAKPPRSIVGNTGNISTHSLQETKNAFAPQQEPKSLMQPPIKQKFEMNNQDVSPQGDNSDKNNNNNNPRNIAAQQNANPNISPGSASESSNQLNQHNAAPILQTSPPCFPQSQFDPHIPQYCPDVDFSSLPMPSVGQDHWGPEPNLPALLLPYNSLCGLKDWSDENPSSGAIYNCLNLDGTNSGSTVMDPSSVSSTILDDFCALKNVDFSNPSNYLVGNYCSAQDVQSGITSSGLADSRPFSVHEFGDNSGGGASSSNVDLDEAGLLQQGSFKQVTPRFRTYTKIQKVGSVGRSIDVSSFKNYNELRSEIERMFGLDRLLNDSGSGWTLVYVDFENDVLLVGDDPWEEFVGCVRCIRILSPSEVKQMGEEGMQLLNTAAMQGVNGSALEVGCRKTDS